MSNKSISCYRIFRRAATGGGRPTTAPQARGTARMFHDKPCHGLAVRTQVRNLCSFAER